MELHAVQSHLHFFCPILTDLPVLKAEKISAYSNMKVLLHVHRTRTHTAELSSRYLFIKSAPLILEKDYKYTIKTQQTSMHRISY
jgi:hypothetical protein